MAPNRRRSRPTANNDEDPIPARRARQDTPGPVTNNPAPDFLTNEEIQAAIQAEEQFNQSRRQIEEDQAMARQLQNRFSPPIVHIPNVAPVIQPAIVLTAPRQIVPTPVAQSNSFASFFGSIAPISSTASNASTTNTNVSTPAVIIPSNISTTNTNTSALPSSIIPSNDSTTNLNVSSLSAAIIPSNISTISSAPSFVRASTLMPVNFPQQGPSSFSINSTTDRLGLFMNNLPRFSNGMFMSAAPSRPFLTNRTDQSTSTDFIQTTTQKVSLATKPLPYDGSPCSICFEDMPTSPVACQFCKKCVGCQACLLAWSKSNNLPNNRQCPLCRFNWKSPKPKTVAMFISQMVLNANSSSNSPAVKPKKKTPLRKLKKAKVKTPVIGQLVEVRVEPIQPVEVIQPVEPELPNPNGYNTRSRTRRPRNTTE